MNATDQRFADFADAVQWHMRDDSDVPQPTSARTVRFVCAYCHHEVPYDGAPHCGEVHSEPMSEGED
jgi:hypothetical protein